jgi:RNA-binding protein
LTALKTHELIKIKLGQNCPLERNEAARELALLTEATLVQVIGRMVLLYRPNPDLPIEKRVL